MAGSFSLYTDLTFIQPQIYDKNSSVGIPIHTAIHNPMKTFLRILYISTPTA